MSSNSEQEPHPPPPTNDPNTSVTSEGRSTRRRGPPPIDVPHIAPTRRVQRNQDLSSVQPGQTQVSDLLSSSSQNPGATASPAGSSSFASALNYFTQSVAPPPHDESPTPKTESSDEESLEDFSDSVDLDAMGEAAFNQTLAALKSRANLQYSAFEHHESGLAPLSLTDAQLHVEDLKELGKDLTALHRACFTTFTTAKKDPAAAVTPLEDALERYSAVHAIFAHSRSQFTALVRTLTPITGAGLKPPKLSLPTFKGIHGEWPAFKSAFTTLVRDSPAFSPNEKLR